MYGKVPASIHLPFRNNAKTPIYAQLRSFVYLNTRTACGKYFNKGIQRYLMCRKGGGMDVRKGIILYECEEEEEEEEEEESERENAGNEISFFIVFGHDV
jgi:hypothetical protein